MKISAFAYLIISIQSLQVKAFASSITITNIAKSTETLNI